MLPVRIRLLVFSASRNATVLIACMKSSFQVPSILVIDRIGRDPELCKVNLLTIIAFAAPFPCYYNHVFPVKL